MTLIISAFVFILSCLHIFGSEFAVTDVNTPSQQDFSGFRGTLDTLPAGWIVSTNGAMAMATTNGFHGVASGSVTAGGCYAWSLAGSTGGVDYALGCQPTDALFTPGFFMVVVSNATAVTVRDLSISYEVVCLNNTDRSSMLDLQLSLDGATFVTIKEMSFVSPQTRSDISAWTRSIRSGRIAMSLPVKPGQCVWLRWYSDDAAGSGARDEYGIDKLLIAFHCRYGTVLSIR